MITLMTNVLVNPSKEPESIIRVGDWVWVQYVTEDGEVDNNLALAVAVLRFKSGTFAVALLWGKITTAGWNGGPQRVVCTDDCQVVDKESIAGRVIEPEEYGRILTENSVGAKFSLDRYHVFSDSYGNVERLELVSFETESGRPSERFLQEVTLAEGSPMNVQSPVQPSLLRETSDKSYWRFRMEDYHASVQADGEADAETDVEEQGMANSTAHTEAIAKLDGVVHTRSDIETDTETSVRSDLWAIVDVGGIGKTGMTAEPEADDAKADGEADGKTEVETELGSGAGAETDSHADTEPQRAKDTESHTKAVAECGAAPGKLVSVIIEGSYAYTPQPPKRLKVAGSPAISGPGERMPSKAYSMNVNAIEAHDLRKSQPLSTPDEESAVKERKEDLLHARHKLQRMFLQKSSAPSEWEVSAAGKLLTWLELRPDLEWDLMRKTKIYKALEKVRDLSSIPGERGDALRRRCAALFDVWESRKESTVGRRPQLIRRA
ncbi:hypothetical protein E2P81_ATG10617 [Venturia nashicola]|nr:hypothetical protein E2P81_ATG10617 [Venturia nashicola]